MGAYIIKCEEVIKDSAGKVSELICSCDLETGGGVPLDGRKVKGTIHWLSELNACDSRINIYDRLFTLSNVFDIPEGKTYTDYLNPNSLTIASAKVERSLLSSEKGEQFQFVRTGYFCKDTKYDNCFNLIVGLKDSYKK